MSDFQKQTVQWFPGHMAKTRRLIKESLSLVDGVVELVDARIPFSSRNPDFDDLLSTKPRMLLLNKCDIADPAATKQWVDYYSTQGIAAIAVDCRSGKGLNQFIPLVQRVLKNKIDSNNAKGMHGKAIRIMVLGVPNTGKSSLINRLAGKNRAKVADKPGVTRQNQWFVIGNRIEMLDTPGVLWPKFDDEKIGNNLAFTGAVKDEVVDIETLAVRLIDTLRKNNAQCITERYGIPAFDELESWQVLELIGKKRGFLLARGEIDYQRTSVILIDEFRGGKLGRITLELPE